MSVLDEIVAGVKADLAVRKKRLPLAAVQEQARAAVPALPVLPQLRGPRLSVIAEVKRRSPSKGDLATIADPASLAVAYARGGAAAISVLTEQRRFNGTLADLDAVRAAVEIPVLRKDFMVDEYQFFEARAHGADLVLLIVAALTDYQLARFGELTASLGMTALVETHTLAEVDRAQALGFELIGVNNRNLKTLEVDLGTFATLAGRIDGAVKVAESGIMGAADVATVVSAGADVVLVGEALVKHGDPTTAIGEFVAAAEGHLS